MIKLRFPGDYIYVSSPFGKRTVNGKTTDHGGVDLGWSSKHGGQHTPIFAAADGVIETVVDGKGNDMSTNTYGNYVIINHGNGVKTLYGHLLKNSLLKKGTKLIQGQQFAKKDNSGYSFGSHCHFEVRIKGKKVDPLKYTYADVKMIIASDTSKKYKILKYDFSKPEPVVPTPVVPTPVSTVFKKGEKVVPTKLISYTGSRLVQYDKQYVVYENSRNDRVILAAPRHGKLVIWAAMNTKNVRRK